MIAFLCKTSVVQWTILVKKSRTICSPYIPGRKRWRGWVRRGRRDRCRRGGRSAADGRTHNRRPIKRQRHRRGHVLVVGRRLGDISLMVANVSATRTSLMLKVTHSSRATKITPGKSLQFTVLTPTYSPWIYTSKIFQTCLLKENRSIRISK